MSKTKFTKIIATIGPACDDEKTLKGLYDAGMNIARLNFSHGAYDYFEKVITNIRNVSNEIAILLDTKGPEIRSGEVENGSLVLEDNQELILTKDIILGNSKMITINYNHVEDLEIGNKILIDDGLIETQVIDKHNGNAVKVKVINGGLLGSRKTITIRGHNVTIPFLSKKDKEDILFGIKQGVDFVAASFVRKESEVVALRKFLDDNDGKIIKIISKIEHGEAIENIEAIINESSGIMVARGDLGVEMPLEQVPKLQEDIITRCKELGKPVVVATQMLESMKDNPRPTRAEVGDVAQAILQGTDAVMLSGETAGGKYPIKAVETMATIAKEYDMSVENRILESATITHMSNLKDPVATFITKAAFLASQALNAKAILITTESGFSARKVARFKAKCPVYAITHNMSVLRQLQISWGVFPMLDENHHKSHDGMVNELVKKCSVDNLLNDEDKVVVTSGHILSKRGHTNMLEIYKVKCILDRM